MAPLTRESEGSGQTTVGSSGGGGKPQPVAVEIPITVNGARTVHGGDKREPFSESTQTVLVFGSGAVIRLAAAVGPGQLLFVTNEKSQKEVVCQVVKSKQNGGSGGYVELKFTEAAADFWGVRFPGAGPALATPSAPILPTPVPSLAQRAKSPEEKLTDLNSATPPASMAEPAKAAEPVPAMTIASRVETSGTLPRMPSTNEPKLAPVVTMPTPMTLAPAAPPAKIPTLSEFLTKGANGLELSKERSASEKPEGKEKPVKESQAEKMPPAALPSSTAKLREEAPSLAAALGIQQNVAPGALSFDLAAEEVKIPSWLEPLARNSMPGENKTAEASPETNHAIFEAEKPEASSASETEPVPREAQNQSPLLASEGHAPNFGSSLPLDADSEATNSSGKSWRIAVAVVVALLIGAGVWYWYVNQPPKVSASGNHEAAEGGMESLPAPAPAPVESSAATTNPVASTPSSSKLAESAPEPSAGSPAPAAGLPHPAGTVGKEPAKSKEEAREEPAKKPTLGSVHLAAPKVLRGERAQEAGAADPGLSIGGETNSDSGNLALLAGKGKGPAAPVVIGGEVQPAQLLSSVPPVYPQMARSQRISGDVTLDLLVDVRGSVSATRVISGSPLLHQAALDAVKQWKYKPAILNGQPTAMHVTVTVQFRLQ